MSLRIVRSPSFRDLLTRLIADVQAECRRAPFDPKWVLTPTSVVANQVRTAFAAASNSPDMGIRVAPLSQLVHRLCQEKTQDPPVRWDPFLDTLLSSFVAAAQKDDAFPGLSIENDGHSLLVPTFLDLAEAGFGPEQSELLGEFAEEGGLEDRAKATLLLYLNWIQTLDDLDYPWLPRLQLHMTRQLREMPRRALLRALAAEQEQEATVFLFGFYDFTDLNLETVAALSSQVPVNLLLPGLEKQGIQPGSPYHLTQELVEDLSLRVTATRHEWLPPSDPSTRFFLNTFPEGVLGEQPDLLSFQKVSGMHSEALAAAVRVRRWLDQNSDLNPEEILVVVPDTNTYYSHLRIAFEQFRLPLDFPDLELETSPGLTALGGLAQLLATGAATEWLFDYGREFPEVAHRLLAQPESFERKLRKVSFPGGPAAWTGLWDQIQSDRAHIEAALGPLSDDEISLIGEVIELWLGDGRPNSSLGAEAACTWLGKISQWLPDPSLMAEVIESVREIAEADGDRHFNRQALLRLALRTTAPESAPSSPDLPSIRALSYMKARGLSCRGLVFLGLSAANFPHLVEEDSLLPDAIRRQIASRAQALGHRLPIKSRVSEEMTLLFSVLNTSAEFVHWVIPESDENGRAVAPSPYVLRYLNRWAGQEFARPFSRRVPRSPLQQAEWLLSLDPLKGAYIPPETLAWWLQATNPASSTSVPETKVSLPVDELDPARQGWIPGAQLRSGEKLLSLSVTSLETLAKCPFRFWGERIARLEALPLASWTGTITPLERGSLVHASLAALVQNHPGASIQSIAQKAATRGDIESSLESLPPEYFRLSLLPESIRRALLRDIVETVASYLAALVEGDCRDGIPEAAECRLVADIPSLPGCTLVGVVDRIDVADGKARVVDYKTSKSPFRKRGRPEEAEEVACGFLLQPSLYPWLVENSLKRPVEGFSYVYLGDPPPVEVHFDRIPPADELFRQFKPILENRLFVPTPNEFYAAIERDNLQSCRYCEFVSLCRRFDRVSMGTVIKLMSQRASARFRVLHGASSAEGPNVDH